MTIEETKLKGCVLIKPDVYEDERGYFFESFNANVLGDRKINLNFVQDNQSFSSYGTVRGLHLQKGDHAQAKLVRVLSGEVLDVAVDLRKNSPTFGKHFSIILTAENHKQLFVPRGFAHGFLVLEDNTTFNYKCSEYYDKPSERAILWNDNTLNIDWQIKTPIISKKDKIAENFANFVTPF